MVMVDSVDDGCAAGDSCGYNYHRLDRLMWGLVTKKRKRGDLQESEVSSLQGLDVLEDPKNEVASVAPKQPRFQKGQRVICNLPMSCPAWKPGWIEALFHEMEDGETVPYIVKLDNGQQVAPDDEDDMIRLAARACSDINILLAFAVHQARWNVRDLRFAEGDRVAVQLDAGVWEEGFVIEVWAQPPGTKPKAWSRVAVPYAVRLDIGDDVLVPYDEQEVIRAESADLPPQKPIADQIGGRSRTPLVSRFIHRFNAAGERVQVDTRTGRERPCKL